MTKEELKKTNQELNKTNQKLKKKRGGARKDKRNSKSFFFSKNKIIRK